MNMALDFINVQPFQKHTNEQISIGKYCYSLNEVIGHGCSSVVYKGKSNMTNERVAVKIIDLKRVSTTIQKVLLENQKKIVQRLIQQRNNRASGIIQFQAIVETPKQVCIVMQHCPGGDLEKVIKLGKVGEDKAKNHLLKLLVAYKDLAQNKIIHRDLKPANILIDQFGNLKLTDFGFAIFQQAQSYRYNYCVGSPVYCSPQALEKFQNGIKSDIWALGVIVYKMLTTKTPWKGKNNKQLINNMKTIPVVSLLEDVKDKDLKQFIIGCCKVEIKQRFGIKQIDKYIEILRQGTQTQISTQQDIQQHKQKLDQYSFMKQPIIYRQVEKNINVISI